MRLKEIPPVLRRGLLIIGLKELIELRKAEETIIQSDLVDGFIRNDQFMRSCIDAQFIDVFDGGFSDYLFEKSTKGRAIHMSQ